MECVGFLYVRPWLLLLLIGVLVVRWREMGRVVILIFFWILEKFHHFTAEYERSCGYVIYCLYCVRVTPSIPNLFYCFFFAFAESLLYFSTILCNLQVFKYLIIFIDREYYVYLWDIYDINHIQIVSSLCNFLGVINHGNVGFCQILCLLRWLCRFC